MHLPRTQKILLINNKGGVGKTTVTFQFGAELARRGYRVGLVDLDPQCNLTLYALGERFFEENLYTGTTRTIFHALQATLEGSGDLDRSVPFLDTGVPGLSILPGDIRMWRFEEELPAGFASAAAGNRRGFILTSAINRFLERKGADDQFDFLLLDTSPSLGALNQTIFLGTDFFIVPLRPDAFSAQGIENLGEAFAKWRDRWKISMIASAKLGDGIPAGEVLAAEGVFFGFVTNDYRIYDDQPMKERQKWIDEIVRRVRVHLSERHSRNDLVAKSQVPLGKLGEYGKVASLSQRLCLPFSAIPESAVRRELKTAGTTAVHERACAEVTAFTDHVLERMNLPQTLQP